MNLLNQYKRSVKPIKEKLTELQTKLRKINERIFFEDMDFFKINNLSSKIVVIKKEKDIWLRKLDNLNQNMKGFINEDNLYYWNKYDY